MTTAAVVALEKYQFMHRAPDAQRKAAQGHLPVGRVNMDIIGANDFTPNICDTLGEVHVDEAGSPNNSQSHVYRTL